MSLSEPWAEIPALRRVEFHGSASEWDELCARFQDFTVQQTYAWGEGRRADGWAVARDQWFTAAGELAAAATVLRRRRYGVPLAYISRGPLVLREGVSQPETEACWKACVAGYRAGLRWGEVLLCYVYQTLADLTPPAIREVGLHPLFPDTGEYAFSALVRLSSRDQLLDGATAKWRKRFRQSEELLSRVKASAHPRDAERAQALLARIREQKNFGGSLTDALMRSLVAAGTPFFFLEDDGGDMAAMLFVAKAGARSSQLISAVDPEQGRLHPGIGRVLEVAAARWAFENGVRLYDLEGLNPYNKGVYEFKAELRGAMFCPAGLHACSQPSLLARAYSLVRRRAWSFPLFLWRASRLYFLQLACQRLTGDRLSWFRLGLWARALDQPAPDPRPGLTLLCLDHFDPEDFRYRLSTVRRVWNDCRDLEPSRKECFVLLGKHGYALAYGFLFWDRVRLPEIDTLLSLEPGDVYIANCFVIPEARGDGLYRYLLQQMCARAGRRGARRAWISVNAANRHSVRGIENAGFRLYKEAGWLRLGPWRRLRWRENHAGE